MKSPKRPIATRPEPFVVDTLRNARRQIGRKRLTPDERERRIAQEAVRFFAERGFEGQTRELAKRIGITQPLLYRYFPSKEALIERVYQEVFVGRWNPHWEEWLDDRSRPLEERLVRFYQDYARTILGYEWVRLFMFSGLRGLDINSRYVRLLRDRVFSRVIAEIRFSYGRPPLVEVPMTEAEMETVWGLHAAIFYLGVRRWIYGLPIPADLNRTIAEKVAVLLEGALAVFPAARKTGATLPRRKHARA
ncbi:MAG TPA: TetR/AcrR family transcriptional regulator [Alphaproteobacteria bacterium]|nr:TetR/AcrR family transcriptional regulator [Alphaproteobacteria bacterium]